MGRSGFCCLEVLPVPPLLSNPHRSSSPVPHGHGIRVGHADVLLALQRRTQQQAWRPRHEACKH